MKIRRTSYPGSILNITPLIDVVFILLVFFMLATNFAAYRLIRVDTPRETEVVTTIDGAIVIGITEGGGLTFDTRTIPQDGLVSEVAAVVALDPGRVFLIRPEDGVSLQEAISVYDAARSAGAAAVSFSPPAGDAP